MCELGTSNKFLLRWQCFIPGPAPSASLPSGTPGKAHAGGGVLAGQATWLNLNHTCISLRLYI